MNVDIEITLIKDLPDVLCYLYLDGSLLDAISASNEAMITSIPSTAKTVFMVAKDSLTSEIIFKEEIFIDDLLTKTLIIPEENPLIILHTRQNAESPSKLQPVSEPRNTLKSLAFVEEYQQKEQSFLQDLLEKTEKREKSLAKEIKFLYSSYLEFVKNTKLRRHPHNANDCLQEVEELCNGKNTKENVFLVQKDEVNQDIYKQNVEIAKLKADNNLLNIELESFKNELRLQKYKNEMNSVNELLNKKSMLLSVLDEKSKELTRKHVLALEMQNELRLLQDSHRSLQSYLYSMRKLCSNLEALGKKNLLVKRDSLAQTTVRPELNHKRTKSHEFSKTCSNLSSVLDQKISEVL